MNKQLVISKVIKKMKRPADPFDHIDLIISTHLHADHLKVGFVSDYLVKNKRTGFISTAETAKIMEKNLPEFILYSKRVQGLNPGWGEIKFRPIGQIFEAKSCLHIFLKYSPLH